MVKRVSRFLTNRSFSVQSLMLIIGVSCVCGPSRTSATPHLANISHGQPVYEVGDEPCQSEAALERLDTALTQQYTVHIDKSSAQASPFAPADDGRNNIYTCAVSVPAIGRIIIYRVSPGQKDDGLEFVTFN